jgi:hypothetical protein
MGIENIHVMRKSFLALQALCQGAKGAVATAGAGPDEAWHASLATTQWLEHSSCIIAAAEQITQLVVEEKASVLVHCSDGWDRTPQVPTNPFYYYNLA